jgi:hypothetical protein
MRISLRELMIVVAFAAVGCAALKYATITMQAVVQGLTGALLLGFLVRAIVDRGPRQAFAIGFVACAIVYIVARHVDGTTTTFTGAFGTTRLITAVHPLFISENWINSTTGEAVRIENAPPDARHIKRIERMSSGSEPTVEQSAVISSSTQATIEPINRSRSYQDEIVQSTEGRRMIAEGAAPSSLRMATYGLRSTPSIAAFRTVGYCLLTLLVGYVGGHFARYVYARRTLAAGGERTAAP